MISSCKFSAIWNTESAVFTGGGWNDRLEWRSENFDGRTQRFAGKGSKLNKKQSSARNDRYTGWHDWPECDFTCKINCVQEVEKNQNFFTLWSLIFEFESLSGKLEFRWFETRKETNDQQEVIPRVKIRNVEGNFLARCFSFEKHRAWKFIKHMSLFS